MNGVAVNRVYIEMWIAQQVEKRLGDEDAAEPAFAQIAMDDDRIELAGMGVPGLIARNRAAHGGAKLFAAEVPEKIRLAVCLVGVVGVEIGSDQADFLGFSMKPREIAKIVLGNTSEDDALANIGCGVGHGWVFLNMTAGGVRAGHRGGGRSALFPAAHNRFTHDDAVII